MISIFFSYSHNDENLRNELEKHLSILKRQGVIDTWHDRRITAGSDLNTEISEHLKNADIILLLISSDFLASDYCYDNEMKFAMKMHEAKKAVVIPVILRPCDWQDTPFGKLLAAPKDGKAVTKFQSLDEAFLDITSEIKRVVQKINSTDHSVSKKEQTLVSPKSTLPRSSNLRITKQFSDHDKDKFLNDAFEYIANYFEGSLKELKERNPQVEYSFKRVDLQTMTASIYIKGEKKCECMIYFGSDHFISSKSISYSNHISSSRNSLNESFSVAEDGYNLYLKPLGMTMWTRNRTHEALSNEGAAEYYWSLFIDPLQRNE